MKNMLMALALSIALPLQAIPVKNQADSSVGNAHTLKCGTNLKCAIEAGKVVVSPPGGVLVAASTTALTKSQCGSTVYNAGAVAQPLPLRSTVDSGCRYTFITRAASNFDVDPNSVDLIAAATNAAGDMIRNATVGNSVTLDACGTSEWCVSAIYGTWSDAN
jgi:hypothetical protein